MRTIFFLIIGLSSVVLVVGGIWLYHDYNQFRFDRLSDKWSKEDAVKRTERGKGE